MVTGGPWWLVASDILALVLAAAMSDFKDGLNETESSGEQRLGLRPAAMGGESRFFFPSAAVIILFYAPNFGNRQSCLPDSLLSFFRALRKNNSWILMSCCRLSLVIESMVP